MENSRPRPHQLDDSIAFILGIAQGVSFAAFASRVDEPDLQPGRYAILHFIGRHPGLRQTELSTFVNRDKTTLTAALGLLEKQGLVLRQPDPHDGRARRLSLTGEGKETLRRLRVHAAAYDDLLDGIMGDQDGPELRRLLRKLIDGLQRERR